MTIDDRSRNEQIVESQDLQVDALGDTRATLPELTEIREERRNQESDLDEISRYNANRRSVLQKMGIGGGGLAARGLLGGGFGAMLAGLSATPAHADEALDKQISELSLATTPDGTEWIPLLQGAVTKRAALSTLLGVNVTPRRTRAASSTLDTVIFPFRALSEPGTSQYYDEVVMIGINLADQSANQQDTGHGSVWWQLETKFRQSSSSPFITEAHLNFLKPGQTPGTQARPLSFSHEHVSGKANMEVDARVEWWDSARTSQRAVFDFHGTDRALRLVNNTILWVTSSNSIPANGADPLIIVERAGGAAADAIFRVQADGNCAFGGVYNQYGGGRGVLSIGNATTLPSTNPTGGGILYADGGALKWRGPSGTVTTIAVA